MSRVLFSSRSLRFLAVWQDIIALTVQGLSSLTQFTASYFHRVSKDVEAGAKAVYDTKATTGGVTVEVGCKA